MAKAKGIRISDLAKELGLAAKAILEKIHAEGIESQKELKTSSSIPLGLAETVRDWKSTGELKSAEDSNVAVAEKERPKRPTLKKKNADGEDVPHEEDHDSSDSAEHGEPHHAEAPTHVPVVAEVRPHIEATPVPPPVTPAATVEAIPSPTPQATATIATPVAKPVEPITPVAKPTTSEVAPVVTPSPFVPAPKPTIAPTQAPHTVRPAATIASPTTPGAHPPAHGSTPGGVRGHTPRPTVKLDAMPGRDPSLPPPRLVQPTKAVVSGPKLIREEKPDVVSAPRPRGPRMPGGSNVGPGFRQLLPRGGAGVPV